MKIYYFISIGLEEGEQSTLFVCSFRNFFVWVELIDEMDSSEAVAAEFF